MVRVMGNLFYKEPLGHYSNSFSEILYSTFDMYSYMYRVYAIEEKQGPRGKYKYCLNKFPRCYEYGIRRRNDKFGDKYYEKECIRTVLYCTSNLQKASILIIQYSTPYVKCTTIHVQFVKCTSTVYRVSKRNFQQRETLLY